MVRCIVKTKIFKKTVEVLATFVEGHVSTSIRKQQTENTCNCINKNKTLLKHEKKTGQTSKTRTNLQRALPVFIISRFALANFVYLEHSQY